LLCLLIGNWAWRLLRLLPGFSMIRFPLVWVYLTTFYFAWLGALGCDELLRSETLGRRSRVLATGIPGRVCLALAACWAVAWWRLGKSEPEGALRWSINVQTPLAGALGIVGGLCLAGLALVSLKRAAPAAAWLSALTVLIAAHLAAFPFGAHFGALRAAIASGGDGAAL